MARKAKKIEAQKVDTSYNGWKNYESWAVALWIDNEEPSYHHARRLALQAKNESEEQKAELEETGKVNGVSFAREAHGILADTLKAWMEEQMPELGASLWADLLGAAFSEVDWIEVAEHYLSE